MKKTASIIVIILLAFLFIGCSQHMHIHKVSSPITANTEKQERKKSYKIGERQTTYIGNPIIKVKHITQEQKVTKTKAMLASENFIITGGYLTVTGSKDIHYDIVGDTTIDNVVYTIIKVPYEQGFAGVLVHPDGNVYHKVANIRHGILVVFTFEIIPEDLRFIFSEKVEIKKTHHGVGGASNSELIYGGTDGRSFKITYREYTGEDMARSAFSQNLVYETNTNQIRYKDYVIKIHEVTNEKIVYTVISDGFTG